MAIFIKAENFIEATRGELADKLSRNNDPVETKDQLVYRWFQMLEGVYNSAQVDEDMKLVWQRVVEKIRDSEATTHVCFKCEHVYYTSHLSSLTFSYSCIL
jgi:hypothetical protein